MISGRVGSQNLCFLKKSEMIVVAIILLAAWLDGKDLPAPHPTSKLISVSMWHGRGLWKISLSIEELSWSQMMTPSIMAMIHILPFVPPLMH